MLGRAGHEALHILCGPQQHLADFGRREIRRRPIEQRRPPHQSLKLLELDRYRRRRHVQRLGRARNRSGVDGRGQRAQLLPGHAASSPFNFPKFAFYFLKFIFPRFKSSLRSIAAFPRPRGDRHDGTDAATAPNDDLADYLRGWSGVSEDREPVAQTLLALADATREIAALIRVGPLAGALGEATGEANADGDTQKKLDLMTNDVVLRALQRAPDPILLRKKRGKS